MFKKIQHDKIQSTWVTIATATQYCSCQTANVSCHYPDGKVPEANMGPIWGRQDPGGPQVGPMNFAIWELIHRLWGLVQYGISIRKAS